MKGVPTAAGALALFLALSPQTRADDSLSEIIAGAGCGTVEDCLSVVTTRHVHEERRYWAKRFLDDHASEEVVDAIAPLLASDLSKLRRLAWWYAATHPEAWSGQLPALLQALPEEPSNAYLVADIGGDEAWGGLKLIAIQSEDASWFGQALRRIDRARAVSFGFSLIEGSSEAKDTDGLLRGIFGEYYASDDAATVRSRLDEVLSGDAKEATRRRAAVALGAAIWSGDDTPELAKLVHSVGPETVRVELRQRWFDVGTPEERASDLAALFVTDVESALLEADRIGEAASAYRAQVAHLLSARDSRTRMFALFALASIDPATWRARRAEIVSGPDLSQALAAAMIWRANDRDTGVPASESGLARAASQSWYPGMPDALAGQEAAERREAELQAWREATAAARKRGDPPPAHPLYDGPADGLQMIISNDAKYADPVAVTCPEDKTPSARSRSSLWHTTTALHEAATFADVDTWHLSAALRTDAGWYVGHDVGEWGGLITFNRHDRATLGVIRTTTEPLAIFGFDGHVYYIAGGPFRADGGTIAELGRVHATAGGLEQEALIGLPSPPVDVVAREGQLLLQLASNGWVDVTDEDAPIWLGCGSTPPQRKP